MPDLDLEGTAADRGEPGEAGDDRAPEADTPDDQPGNQPADDPADDADDADDTDDTDDADDTVDTVDDAPEDDLQDRELSQEIELVGDLVVAASDADADLSTSEIDRILGLGED
jgi:hypothetical protein